ncbi:MAG: hypothetical protein ACYCWW_12755 [Deltaproteobacteria bacterium]
MAFAILSSSSAAALQVDVAGQPLTLTFSETADLAYHLDDGVIAPGPQTPCHTGLPAFLARPVTATPSAEYDPTSDCYADWLNRFDVQASWGRWHGEVRFDSAAFFNAPTVSSLSSPEDLHLATLLENRYVSNLIAEKLSADYVGDHVDLSLGDFYLAYGRGLVLSLTKIDALGVDTTLRGASVTGRFGGFTGNVAAGVTNMVNTDEATGEVAPDPMDRIVGTRLEYRWPRLLTLGVDGAGIFQNPDTAALSRYTPGQPSIPIPLAPLSFGAIASQPFQAPPGLQDTGNFSVTADLPRLWDFGRLYLEAAHQVQTVAGQLEPQGNALFGSLSLFLGPATVLIEGKDYSNFYSPISSSIPSQMFPAFWQQNVYTNAPTLEETFQEEYLTYDIAGPRIRVDVQATDFLTPFASAAFFRDSYNQYDIYDGFLGVDAHWQARRSHATVTMGRRLMFYDYLSPEPGAVYQQEWWLQYDVVQTLGDIYSLELEGLHRRYDEDPVLTGHPWTWSYGYLSLRRHEWSLTLGDEYNSQFPTFYRVENPNIGGSYSPSDRWTVRLFAGGREAGLRCINGICRDYPGFEGVSVEVTARY